MHLSACWRAGTFVRVKAIGAITLLLSAVAAVHAQSPQPTPQSTPAEKPSPLSAIAHDVSDWLSRVSRREPEHHRLASPLPLPRPRPAQPAPVVSNERPPEVAPAPVVSDEPPPEVAPAAASAPVPPAKKIVAPLQIND
jgi:hypothetical protein